MKLQNIITFEENKEEESKTNTLENYVDNNKNIQEEEKDFNNDEINNYKKKIQAMVQITTQIWKIKKLYNK